MLVTTGTPFFFGAAGSPRQFGWYYANTGSVVRETAVLLCPPVAQEYLYSYRAFRILAERLAACGFAVLRFEYPGLGNAEGNGEQPNQLSVWEDGIVAALAELRKRSGVQDVVVVGLRLGATLAMHTLSHRFGDARNNLATDAAVRGMVLWDPVVTGKSYVRQTQMLARTVTGVQRTEQNGELDALGYTISAETVQALSAIDLNKTTLPKEWMERPLSCLVIEREGSASQQKLVAHLEEFGAAVSKRTHPEIDRFLVNAELSVLPDEVLDAIVGWIDATAPESKTPGSAASENAFAPFESRLDMIDGAAATEEVVWFGQRIFGIVTTPKERTPKERAPQAPVILFLNMGTDHHIGPRRMNVVLARTLAVEGAASVRIDLPGIGDSPVREGVQDNISYPPHAIADIQQVIRELRERYGFTRVMLGGMCAGGWHAVHALQADQSLAGIFPINPPLYFHNGSTHAAESFLAREALRDNGGLHVALASDHHWRRLFRGEVPLKHVIRTLRKYVNNTVSSLWRRPSRNGEGERLIKLMSVPVPMLLIFDETNLGYRYFNHHIEPRHAQLRQRDNFTMQVVPGGENVFMSADGQRRLNEMILAWVRKNM